MNTRTTIGFIVTIAGVLLLAEQFGATRMLGFDLGYIIGTFWPLILVGIGISALTRRNTRTGLLLLFVGLTFQITELYTISFWQTLWPLIIIGFGLHLLTKSEDTPKEKSETRQTSEGQFDSSVMFSELKDTIQSNSFESGTIECIFGAAEIDLRNATLADDGATITVTCVFGGVEIIVPEGWQVTTNVETILGGWENNIAIQEKEEAPHLHIKGSIVFGGGEVHT